MSDLPRRAVTRTAKLATLPVGLAGRTALGLGKRLGGRPAEIVAQEIQQRTAEQIFRVLGELKGGALKLGQALSIFEAALPPEIAGPVPGHADPACRSRRPRCRSARCTRCWPSDLGPDWRDQLRRVRRPPGRGGLDRPGPPGRLERRPRGRREDPVPRRREGPEQRLHPAQPRRPAVRRADARPGHQAAAGRAAVAGGRGAGLPAGGRLAAGLRRRLRRRPGHLRAAGRHGHRPRRWSPSGWTAPRCPGSSPTAPRSSATGPGILLVRFLFSGPARAGLLHATRIRATSGCWTTAGSGCWTSARSTGCRTAAAVLRPAAVADAQRAAASSRSSGNCASTASCARASAWTWRSCTRSWPRWLSRRRWTPSSSAVSGCGATATRVTDLRPSNVTRQLNLPPSYVLIHRVSTAGIGVLCQLECEGPFRAEVLTWMPGLRA